MKTSLFILTFILAAYIPPVKKMEHRQVVYSQKMVESRAIKNFSGDKAAIALARPNWDYVSGLVAYGVLKAWEQYPEKKEYYQVVKAFADNCLKGQDTIKVGASNVDDLAAGKIFFALYQTELKNGNTADAARYKKCVTFLRNKLKYNHSRIDASKPGAGGFFHKAQYPNQMWLDGLYMAPALYAGWQANFGKEEGADKDYQAWKDIALQFKTIHKYTYDPKKQLNYHAWSADPQDENSFWAQKSGPFKGCSPEFWARGMGWYFAALVDVLEVMPKTHADYQALRVIVNQVAAGLARYQDKTGSWYQLLQYNSAMKSDNKGDAIAGQVFNVCDKPNYLESSASSMFTYAYLKGIRLNVLDRKTFIPVAEKAYKGLLANFIREENSGLISIIQSCNSAGLGPARDPSRTGTINYYLCGKDVTITQNEGKAIGPFIMASLEYERRK